MLRQRLDGLVKARKVVVCISKHLPECRYMLVVLAKQRNVGIVQTDRCGSERARLGPVCGKLLIG